MPEAGAGLGSAAFGVLDVSTFIADTEVEENLVCSGCISRNDYLELITSNLKRKQHCFSKLKTWFYASNHVGYW